MGIERTRSTSPTLGPPPDNLLEQYSPPDRSASYVQGMLILGRHHGLELDDDQLSVACAWFMSHPDLGMRYLRELKESKCR